MDCTEARTRLDAYFDQELDLPNAVAIDQHLASCPDCSTELTCSFAMSSTLPALFSTDCSVSAAPFRTSFVLLAASSRS